MNDKKFKKIVVTLLAVIIGLILIAGIVFWLMVHHVQSTKRYCSDYATQQEKTSKYPEDARYSIAYDRCMRDKGLSGFGSALALPHSSSPVIKQHR